jgi:hypothetical protein
MSGADPLGGALTFAADGLERTELRQMLRARRDKLVINKAEIAADLERLVAKGFLGVLDAAVMRRGIMRIEAEIRWHDDLDAALAVEGCQAGAIAMAKPTGGQTALGAAADEAGARAASAGRADTAPDGDLT